MKQFTSTYLNCLICSLYTFSKTHKFFKTINVENASYFNEKNNEYFLIDAKISNEFYQFLNKSSIRDCYISLTNSCLMLDYFLISDISKNKVLNEGNCEEIILFKKYLRKFKHNYYRYFISKEESAKNLPPGKEVNKIAIKFLFLLTGI